MRTKRRIASIVAGAALLGLVLAATVIAWLKWAGVAVVIVAVFALLLLYAKVIGPWHRHWGAVPEEVDRCMPGDDIIPRAFSTTRGITIHAPPEEIWPWLVQLGYGRAGWYSYDWIDNDGRPSAAQVQPELQVLSPGDVIEMTPGDGPAVIEVEPGRYFLAGDREGGTWCVALYSQGVSTRLLSRWRQAWQPRGFGPRFFTLIADPGAFIMERKMLQGIKKRAESRAPGESSGADEHLSGLPT